MHGILNLHKPSGITSYDCIRRLKKTIGKAGRTEPMPIGHAGTLDPMASGVLLILVGAATRLSRFLLGTDKEYEAEVLFGIGTDTDDVTGRTTAEGPIPQADPEELRKLLFGFVGIQSQVPPVFSALKQQGRPAYRLARQGEQLEMKARQVTVRKIELLGWTPPRARLRALVSSGTYIRALARDIGRAAGTVATLSGLVRTRSGIFTLSNALPLDRADADSITACLVPIPDALPNLPKLEVSAEQALRLRQGRIVEAAGHVHVADAEYALASTSDRRFLGLVKTQGNKLKTLRVIYAD